uniref:Transcriptional regulator n=1 Tax=Globodera pallida TaxID=36090 RepID=A0A183CPV8_GLOPA
MGFELSSGLRESVKKELMLEMSAGLPKPLAAHLEHSNWALGEIVSAPWWMLDGPYDLDYVRSTPRVNVLAEYVEEFQTIP